MGSHSFAACKAGYAALWDKAHIASAHVDAAALSKQTAQHALAHKAVYQQVETALASKGSVVPWWVIPPLHYREADFSLSAYLGNGQSLANRTTEVPAGRGPFAGPNAFLDGSIDAIVLQLTQLGVKATTAATWTIEFALWFWEGFNGFGYPDNSPYIWNWTDQYHGGKFIADHDYSASTWDVQGGCAAIIKQMAGLDASIVIARDGAPMMLRPPMPAAMLPAAAMPVLAMAGAPSGQMEAVEGVFLDLFGIPARLETKKETALTALLTAAQAVQAITISNTPPSPTAVISGETTMSIPSNGDDGFFNEQVMAVLAGLARHGLTSLGGVLVSGGYLQSSETTAFVGGGMILLGAAWSWWQKTGQAKVAALLKNLTKAKTTGSAVAVAQTLPPGSAVTRNLP